MSAEPPDDPDRRIRRTRKAVFDAFVRLVLVRRYDAIRTADLIESAGIGRSTFYEHFRNKDEVLLGALEPLFAPLADAAVGLGGEMRLRMILSHLWDQRALGRIILEPPLLAKVQRRLAGMIETRLTGRAAGPLPPALEAAGAAAEQLAVIRGWITGEASSPVEAIAKHLSRRRQTSP